MKDPYMPLCPGRQYHVVSRAIGDEKMFRDPADYRLFLYRYHRYMNPVADTYCYSLLPNHFHFLLRIKAEAELKNHFMQMKQGKEYSPELLPDFTMERFSNFLNSYAKTYNNKYDRKGGLFIDYLRRVEIEDELQFGTTVFYIHKNPVHHGYCEKMEQWPWSSYKTMLSHSPTKLLRAEVLDFFGGVKGFQEYHNQPIFLKNPKN